MKRVLLVDNYDSFTFNLFQALAGAEADVKILRNDVATPGRVARIAPDAIVISPGPGAPESAGHSIALVRRFSGRVPILGVCLGHQAIAAAFDARVVPARRPRHGKASDVRHDGKGVYRGLDNPFTAVRYHSLVVEAGSLPEDLGVTARSADGAVMGIRHRDFPVEGVQFHPESFLTDQGEAILRNFLEAA